MTRGSASDAEASGPTLPLLRADCSRCAGLCCVLLPFRAADGFGRDKDSGTPCHHLNPADLCSIHDRLRESGWPGCTVFDCFGAGQHVTQHTYGGASWRDPGVDRGEMAAVLSVVRLLHEALHHLAEAARRAPEPQSSRAAALVDRLLGLTGGTPAELLGLDVDEELGAVAPVLRDASDAIRRDDVPHPAPSPPDLSRHDLAGRDLRGERLRGADLHGALLIAADLRGADLGPADLLGADVRDLDVRGTDLRQVLYLTQPQVNACLGDATTALPDGLERPGHWPAAAT